jgi:glycosyltransferase involved in cell wall biosynthesis
MNMIKLAILTKNQNAYSETFIQSQRKLPYCIKFYYGGFVPYNLDGQPGHSYQDKGMEGFGREETILYDSLKNEQIDCVIVNFGTVAACSLNVIKALNLPMVVHFHGYDISNSHFLQQYIQGYCAVFDYARYVVGVSKKMVEDLIRIGCPAEKIVLTYYGASPAFLQTTPSYASRQFVSIGRFVQKKAPYLTIAAFKKVLERYPDARLVMVGDGELSETCHNLVKAWKMEENVCFKGILSPSEIVSLMEESIAFVQHSVTAGNGDSEGTPVAIMEASSAALPVIATKHAGIPDVVKDGETGFLVSELDIDGMSKAMISLIDSATLPRRMGIAGRELMRKAFTQAYYLQTLESLIEKCVV